MDGVGEWVTTTYGVGRGNEIKLQKQIEFPHSLGLLYSAFTAFLGFEVNEGEYKVMGMAPYGVPRYVDKVWKMIQQNQRRVFCAGHGLFQLPPLHVQDLQPKFEALFGAPRAPKSLFFTEAHGLPEIFRRPPRAISRQLPS